MFIEQQHIEHNNAYTAHDAHMKSSDTHDSKNASAGMIGSILSGDGDTDCSLLLPPDPQHLPEPPLDGEIFFC